MNYALKIFMNTGAIFEFHLLVQQGNWNFEAQCIRWRADGYIGTEKIHIPYEHVLALALGDAEIKTQGMLQ